METQQPRLSKTRNKRYPRRDSSRTSGMAMFPKVTFILGGASSGKTAWAERFVALAGKPPVYLATAEAFDEEMQEKIARHRKMRAKSWRTVEAPLHIAEALSGIKEDETALIDCATLWLSNHLMKKSDLGAQTEALITAIHGCAANVVVVSNEVGQGIVPGNALSRQFRDAQGRLNIRLAAAADLVVHITAGLPLVLKGNLPELPA